MCRAIAAWVANGAHDASGNSTLAERPIGDDPAALQALHPGLGIWGAYDTIHLLMPDGSMKLGGEAVAEVFRRLPSTKWFAWSFGMSIAGFRPFQLILNLGYLLLSDVRPLLGCESCGTPNPWVRAIRRPIEAVQARFGAAPKPDRVPHFTPAVTKT